MFEAAAFSFDGVDLPPDYEIGAGVRLPLFACSFGDP